MEARQYTKPHPMTEDELRGAIKNQVTGATGYLGGEITEDRRKAMDYYLGNPLGNEVDGRSQVVSTDVQDVVESVMPDLMQIFTATEQLARFEPQGEEDEEAAEQATDYVNYVFHRDNEGSLILHDWFKDALLQVNGIVKVHWDERTERTVESFSGLDSDEMTKLVDEPGVEVMEQSTRIIDEVGEIIEQLGLEIDVEGLPTDPEELAQTLMSIGVDPEPAVAVVANVVVYDLTIVRKKEIKRARVENIPPEEFLISRRAKSLDDAPYLAHWKQETISDLISMGYDPEVLAKIPSEDDQEFNEERVTRFERDDEWPYQGNNETDATMREIRVYESYIRIDYDGDGVAELRRIITAGPAYEVLDNEEVAEHPFEALTPIRMPHKFFGRSLADLTEDIQLIKTSLWRQLLDNAYNINNARAGISNKVNLEDYLSNRVGSPIRINTDGPVGDHIREITTAPIGHHIFPLLEYVDTVRETRTGVNRLGQGVDPDALQTTASGMNMLLGRSQQRILLIAQVMAQMGVKRLAKKLLRTLIRHQDKPRVIRLRNEWVKMDPRTWNADMDVEVRVGLGHGTQEAQQLAIMTVAQFQEKVIAFQGGVGPLVGIKEIRNTFEKLAEVTGLKTADPYMKDVTDEDAAQFEKQMSERPDPEMEKAKAEMGLKAQEAQAKAASDRQKADNDIAVKREELAMKREEMAANLEIKKAELALKQREAEIELGLKQATAGLDAEARRQSIQLDREKAEVDKAVKQKGA